MKNTLPHRYRVLKIFLLLAIMVISLFVKAQSPERVYLVDFGPADGVNGRATTELDQDGRKWNNQIAPAATASTPLVTTEDDASAVVLTVVSAFRTNGINHGGLLAPDPDLLDDFAIATVTEDYFFTDASASLEISGLDPSRLYSCRIFATRDNPETRITRYDLTGIGSSTYTLQTSGTDIGADGYDGNNDNILSTAPQYPSAAGTLSIGVSREAGSFAYIGGLALEEYLDDAVVTVDSIRISGPDITENGATSQLILEVFPDSAAVQDVEWTVVQKSTANITPTGELIPYMDGLVTVIARSLDPGSDATAEVDIMISDQLTRQFLVDLGPDDGNDGNATISPDPSGNHWNNLTSPFASSPVVDLVDMEGNALDMSIAVTKSMSDDGIRDGGLLDPTVERLGDLAVSTATQDYFRSSNNGIITITGADPSRGYRFHCLSSRASDERVSTRFAFVGAAGVSGSTLSGGPDVGTDGYDGVDDVIYSSELVFPSADSMLSVEIIPEIGSFGYLNAFRVTEHESLERCQDRNEDMIVWMGSSVARGQGAPDDQGYAYQYDQLLKDRAAAGEGPSYEYVNASVGGNNTERLLARWRRDLPGLCPGYVVYGLSLGNEGIVNGGQAIFDQFRDGLEELVRLAREEDIQPIIVNCYPRQDFDATDYQFVKDMNLLIHQWDLPSINVLGAIDNGTGNWAAGYQADFGHPNLAGHLEYSYSIPPSLFDALGAGKHLPERAQNPTHISMSNDLPEVLTVRLEATMHAFTHRFDVRTDEPGVLSEIILATGDTSRLLIEPAGSLIYEVDGVQHFGDGPDLTDDEWHSITLSHYYAQGRSYLYIDGNLVGDIAEEIEPVAIEINGRQAPAQMDVREWFLYRSGMNQDEIDALEQGAMLKSSLEIYAPLDGLEVLPESRLYNRAQSTQTVQRRVLVATLDLDKGGRYIVSPQPAGEWLQLLDESGDVASDVESLDLYDLHHRMARSTVGESRISCAALQAGIYMLQVSLADGSQFFKKIIKQ